MTFLRRLVFAFLLLALPAAAGPAAPGSARPSPQILARYWVTLRDKNGVRFDPARYFAPEAQARRRRQHLPAADYTDRPVRADYLARLRPLCDTIRLVSRWFNAVSVHATPAQAARLRVLPFVRAVEQWPRAAGVGIAVARRVAEPASAFSLPPPFGPSRPEPLEISPDDERLARQQTASLGARALARAGLDGRGLRIAVFDVGFSATDRHPAFADLRSEQRIVATYDFLKNRADVFRGGSHGTAVLGCLAGRLPGGAAAACLGLAPAASYLLARTEQLGRERYAEEEAWLAAAEWADKNGADLISSSLAYTAQRYFPEQMNGRASLVARAAALAVRKGMLVISAAGNDGDGDWVRIGTPADADSVLAVGGLDPATGLHAAFSSVGPSADRRVKPDLVAFGTVLTAGAAGRGYERLEGTSFSAPLLAGLAACVWQQQRGLTAGQLLARLRQAGDLYPYYDYAHGYGRPLARRLLLASSRPAATAAARPALVPTAGVAPTFDFVVRDSLVAVVLRPAATVRPALPLLAGEVDNESEDPALRPAPPAEAAPLVPPPAPGRARPVGREQPLPAAADGQPAYPSYPPYLYWHLADRRGVLRRYEVRAVSQRLVVQLPRRLLRDGDVWRVHFGGYTGTYSE
ncbi:S8 family serine peptidase [uncultured Hymenobacter sp.]|uniref:S8 family serine peptidase n=1 Tax=uncultured Hymenobacter sp. TaxID=170016 RepID=UPI0035CA498F